MWLKEMEGKVKPISIRQMGEWSHTDKLARLEDMQVIIGSD
jgi:hypothetical protein